jgi:ribonuclease J
MSLPEENLHVLERGSVLDIPGKGAASIAGRIDVGRALVDGRDLETLDDVVIRDRKHLAEDGMMVVMVAFEAETGEIAAGPEIAVRGFARAEETDQVIEECKRLTIEAIERLEPEAREEGGVVRDAIRRVLRKHISKNYDRHPLIVPTLVDM